jgi:hypothetical protein
MATGKPVSITSITEAAYDALRPNVRPQKLLVVGDIASTVLTVVPGTFADLAAVRTYLNTLVTELKASPFFS